MRQLLPADVECIRCDQFGQWWEANDYLHHIINTGADWVVSIDDDCFVTDWPAILALIEHMKQGGYEYAGMPDGGVSPHRCRSWVVMNPFFTVFNAAAIRSKIIDRRLIDACGFQPWMEDERPHFVSDAYNHDYAEPFAGFFYWLRGACKPLYLNGGTHHDGISTTLWGLAGRMLCMHSWYAREFTTDTATRNRILNLYDEARNFSNIS
jgi:hypothetical protein